MIWCGDVNSEPDSEEYGFVMKEGFEWVEFDGTERLLNDPILTQVNAIATKGDHFVILKRTTR